jgi:dTDP-4-amino-4,6-dideoxygalactose transaminase
MARERVLGATLNPEAGDAEAELIPVMRPQLPDAKRLLSYLQRIDAARTYSNWGPLTSELEARLADHFRVPPNGVTSASSGTAALVGAVLATAGRATARRPLALLPAFTFVATALAVEQCGYAPLFVDIDASTWLLRSDAFASHPRRAEVGIVVPVAPYGRAVPQSGWLEFQRRTGLPVVIDGGASFEAVSGAPERFLGEIPVALSFHATKSFSTAEGGCVATTNEHLRPKLTRALNFGFFESRDCRSASINGKMSEYHAAIGLAELDAWPDKQLRLDGVSRAYHRRLTAVGLADRFIAVPSIASCYALYLSTDFEEAERIRRRLAEAKVECRSWYGGGVHQHPYYSRAQSNELSSTTDVLTRLIGLPVAPDLSERSLDRVVAAIARGCA